jgi:hypothetical protein
MAIVTNSSVVANILPYTLFQVKTVGPLGEGRAVLSVEHLHEYLKPVQAVSPPQQVFVPVLWNGVFAWRRVTSSEEIKVRDCEVKSVRVYDHRCDLHIRSRVLTARHVYGVTSDREDGTSWLPSSNLKDGSSLKTAGVTVACRLFDLNSTTASKVQLRRMKGNTVNYALTVDAGTASVVLASGLVIC